MLYNQRGREKEQSIKDGEKRHKRAGAEHCWEKGCGGDLPPPLPFLFLFPFL